MKLSKESRAILLVEIESRLPTAHDDQLLEVARVLRLNVPPRDDSDPAFTVESVEPD